MEGEPCRPPGLGSRRPTSWTGDEVSEEAGARFPPLGPSRRTKRVLRRGPESGSRVPRGRSRRGRCARCRAPGGYEGRCLSCASRLFRAGSAGAVLPLRRSRRGSRARAGPAERVGSSAYRQLPSPGGNGLPMVSETRSLMDRFRLERPPSTLRPQGDEVLSTRDTMADRPKIEEPAVPGRRSRSWESR